jgi:hypothetical protein
MHVRQIAGYRGRREVRRNWNPFKDSWGINVFSSTGSVGKLWNKVGDDLVGRQSGIGKAYRGLANIGGHIGAKIGIETQVVDRKKAAAAAAERAKKEAEAKAVLDATIAFGQDVLSRKRQRTGNLYRPYDSTFSLGSSSRLGS